MERSLAFCLRLYTFRFLIVFHLSHRWRFNILQMIVRVVTPVRTMVSTQRDHLQQVHLRYHLSLCDLLIVPVIYHFLFLHLLDMR